MITMVRHVLPCKCCAKEKRWPSGYVPYLCTPPIQHKEEEEATHLSSLTALDARTLGRHMRRFAAAAGTFLLLIRHFDIPRARRRFLARRRCNRGGFLITRCRRRRWGRVLGQTSHSHLGVVGRGGVAG